MSLQEVIEWQKKIYEAKVKNQKNKDSELDVVKLSQCKSIHFYHKECLENQFQKSEQTYLKCAACGERYGKQIGEMPPGTMTWRKYPFQSMPLQGYNQHNCPSTIVIDYNIPSGQQNGTVYYGTQRTAYLPDNQEGKEVLTLLAEGFRRKLSFKVGTSITTGASNCVVWQGIHHKTSPSGGPTCFGYPDDTYFARVQGELKDRGVTLDQIGNLENSTSGNINVQ